MKSAQWSLRQKCCLSDETYRRFCSSSGRVADLYGLPKIHKPGAPLGPIMSVMSLPTYALSKFLASLLSPCADLTNLHVRNSKQFAEFVTTQTLADTDIFDVVSLFTRAFQVLCDRLDRQDLP